MILLLFAAFAIIILLEVPGMVRKRMWRELVVFFVCLGIGMALSIPQVLGIQLPNPSKALEALYRPLAQYIK